MWAEEVAVRTKSGRVRLQGSFAALGLKEPNVSLLSPTRFSLLEHELYQWSFPLQPFPLL